MAIAWYEWENRGHENNASWTDYEYSEPCIVELVNLEYIWNFEPGGIYSPMSLLFWGFACQINGLHSMGITMPMDKESYIK